MLYNLYRFYIQSASIPNTEVHPLQPNIEFDSSKSELTSNLIRSIDSLNFGKDVFNLLRPIADLGNCEVINITIDTYCTGAFTRLFTGVIKINKCVFDLNKCEVKVKVEQNEIENCVEQKSNDQFNVFNVPFKPTVFSFEGIVERITCPVQAFTLAPINPTNYVRNNSCINISEGWVIEKNLITNIVANGGFFDGNVTTTWIRQKVIGGTVPAGSGWIAVGLDWVRPIQTTQNTVTSYGSYANPLGGDINDERTMSALFGNGTPTNYENGLFLSDTLNYLVNTTTGVCNYTIISDYFSINPDNTHPVNIAYNYAIANFMQIVLYKTADIKRPLATNKSTRLFISLEELIERLRRTFNVEAFIYESAGINYFRIEHVSYFDTINGFDSTTKPISQGNVYSFNTDKVPSIERFYFATQTDETGGTFDWYPILYSKECSDPKLIVENRADVYTNISFLLDNDTYPDDSVCLVATQQRGGQNSVISTLELNDTLTWSNLIDNAHYYNRPFGSGTVNSVSKTFVRARVKQEEIEVLDFSNCDLLNLNENRLMKSEIGWGKIESLKFDALNCKLSATLLH